ncbi:hypothetical protein MNY66_16560 (plasmid) [Moellerella wisconsensis]|uniref:Uncharacterized protein n=1 Tax=Moellerella wisconsensis TaxID=158849 RepID=A0ACD3YCE2_9GAMM|nr:MULTISPECIES: hypothetical protein [Morganellaceae]QCJ72236.1 hypothetical protein C9446_20765 [Providencia heimbachae]UNH40655.1 hypothetical protein MNY70_17610 [Moellerella wisconsensis]UNH44359.1 hypothetical protein MNY66_16560 [Moellerella wisconsensis]
MWVVYTLFWALLGIGLEREGFISGIRDNIWSWKRVFLGSASTSAYLLVMFNFNDDVAILEQIGIFAGCCLFGVLPCALVFKVFLSKKK